MLVLTRKHQEKIRIGDHITITVLKTKGKAVRLGIEAPPDVVVIRGELAVDGAPHCPKLTSQTDDPAKGVVETSSREGREGPQSSRSAPPWTTDPRLQTGKRARQDHSTVDVSLHRVPRDKAAQILPGLAAGGPLRTMMDRRATIE